MKKVLITGATGFVGRLLCKELAKKGYELVIISRNKAKAQVSVPAPFESIEWDLGSTAPSDLEMANLKDVDAVIHLAGEPISGKRWTQSVKNGILESRVQGTENLMEALSAAGCKPSVIVSASAIGYYGDCGDEIITEDHKRGQDFLAHVCSQWEQKLFDSAFAEARKVAFRFGIVLGKGGGALQQMIRPFTLGMGATLAGGRQWMSWIHLEDLVSLLIEALGHSGYSGPINACTAHPVTNSEFTDILSRILNTKSYLDLPKMGLKAMFGQVAEVLTSSQRVLPKKLSELGFEFKYPHLEEALQDILGDNVALGFTEFLNDLWVPQSIDQVFRFFSEAKNLELITPPWLNFKILSVSTPEIQEGTLIEYQLKLHGLPLRWQTEIASWDPPHSFVDVQNKGPYKVWKHTHRFSPLAGGTLIEDRVLYQAPLGFLGKLAAGAYIEGDVEKIFAYRSEKVLAGMVVEADKSPGGLHDSDLAKPRKTGTL